MSKVVAIVFLVFWVCIAAVHGALNETIANGATFIIYQLSEDPSVRINNTEESAGRTFNAWSILWYVGSFVGLVAFFLVISFSEWCCKRRLWMRRNGSNSASSHSNSRNSNSDPAPPAYDLFAPPSYDSIYKEGQDEKQQFEVYVVPISSGQELGVPFCTPEDNHVQVDSSQPPSYSSLNHLQTEQRRNPPEPVHRPQRSRGRKQRAPQPTASSSTSTNQNSTLVDTGGSQSLNS